jgi:hypothetical protein
MGVARQGVVGETFVRGWTFLALMSALAVPWPALGLAVPLRLGGSVLRVPSLAQAAEAGEADGGFVPYEASESAGASEATPAPAPEAPGSSAETSGALAPGRDSGR